MTNTSHPLFDARPDTLPDWVTEVMRLVGRAAEGLAVEHLLVGAIARDLVLQGVFGLGEGRQTLDVDFGVAVADWRQFDDLKSALLASGRFRLHERISHRLLHVGEDKAEHLVDLIPFGGVEERGARIAWPPAGETVMDVAGFREALSSAVVVRIDADLMIRVASIAGMAIMKLLAWKERGEENNRDAGDLHKLLGNYAQAGNEDRLFGDELILLEEASYDFDLAGARLLGKDAAAIASRDTAAKIGALLQSEKQMDRLLAHMLRAVPSFDEGHPKRCTELLTAFRASFLAAMNR